jgi:hypothetical protein
MINSNRFYETFTKFQKINQNMDVKQPSLLSKHVLREIGIGKSLMNSTIMSSPQNVNFQNLKNNS